MKTFYYILLLLLLSSKTILTQWNQQQSGTTADLRGIWFVDSLSGWACGDSGIVLHTSNGGQEWVKQNSTVSVKLEDVFFWDIQTGWIAGDSGTVIHTTNGGISWNEQQTNVTSLLHHIQFITLLNGFASGENETALETTDGGQSWQVVSDSGTASITFFWINQGVGTILTTDTIYPFQSFTVDGGMTWFPLGFPAINANDVHGFRAISPNIIRNYYWDVGVHGKALWISILEEYAVLEFLIEGETNDTLGLNAVNLEQESESIKLWAVGEKGWIISSVDTGQTWQTISSGISVDLYEVSFPQKNRGWAVGDSGIILRYDHPTNVDNSSPDGYQSTIQILEPYPNPFNPTTKINFEVPNVSFVSLKIYDILGREIKELVNEFKPEGKYEIIFDGSGLPSGVYFCQLRSGDFIIARKMVLLK